MPTFSTKQEALDWQKKYGGATIGVASPSAIPLEQMKNPELGQEAVAALGAKTKAKYPTAYGKFTDEEVGQKVLKKYPQYSEFVKSYDPYAQKTTIEEQGGGITGFGKAFVKNIIPEAKNIGTFIARNATGKENILDTAGKILQAPGELAKTAIQPSGQFFNQFTQEQATQDVVDKAKQVGSAVAESVAEDPIGTLLAAGTTKVGKAALKAGTAKVVSGAEKVAEATPKILKTAATSVAKPIERAGQAVSETTKSLAAQIPGLNKTTVEEVINNTQLPKYREIGVDNARRSVLENVIDATDKRLQELSEGGKLYEKARQQVTTLSKEDVLGALEKKLSETAKYENGQVKTVGTSLTTAEGKKIQGALDEIRADVQAADNISGQTLHDIRQKLDKYIDFTDPSVKTANGLIKNLRSTIDDLAKKNVAGLQELDAVYAPEREFMNRLKKDLYKSDGTLKDNAESIVANLANKGNEGKLARMEKLLPGIEKEIKAIRALEDIESAKGIKVGTYIRGALIGGAAIGSGGTTALLTYLATNPSVIVKILETYGRLKRSILSKIKTGAKLSNSEKKSVLESFKRAEEKMKEGVVAESAHTVDTSMPSPRSVLGQQAGRGVIENVGMPRQDVLAGGQGVLVKGNRPTGTPLLPAPKSTRSVQAVVAEAERAMNNRFASGDWAQEAVNATRRAVGEGRLSPSFAETVIDEAAQNALEKAATPSAANVILQRAKWAKERLYVENGLGLSGDPVPRGIGTAVQEAPSSQASSIFGNLETAQPKTQLETMFEGLGDELTPETMKNSPVNLEKYTSSNLERSANNMAEYAIDKISKKITSGEHPMNMDNMASLYNSIKKNNAGTKFVLGDLIQDSEIRELYKDALDTPITIVDKSMKRSEVLNASYVPMGESKLGGNIIFYGGDKLGNIVPTLLHEAEHALRDSLGRSMKHDYSIKK
jgi:hypothetical protein